MAPRAKRRYSNKKIVGRKNKVRASATSLSAHKSMPVARIFPKIKACTFTYADDFTGTVGAGNVTHHNYRANSLYDPDIAAGTARKPRFFHTLLGDNNTDAPYRRYSVLDCDAIATVINQSTQHLYAVLSMYSNQATPPSSVQEAKTRPDCIVRLIPPVGSGSATGKLRMSRSIAQILGVKDMLDNPDMKSNFDTSPAALVVCSLSVFNPLSGLTEAYASDMKLAFNSRLFVRNDVQDSN